MDVLSRKVKPLPHESGRVRDRDELEAVVIRRIAPCQMSRVYRI
jgi:hypothetical protein